MKKLALVACALCFTGCMNINLPPVSASKVEYHRTDPLGGTHVVATGVSVDHDKGTVSAKSVTWNTTYPSFSIQATITDYERKLSSPE